MLFRFTRMGRGHFPERSNLMSNKRNAWHRFALLRVTGYIAPFIFFILLYIWRTPESKFDWFVLGCAVMASCLVPLGTLAQARNVAHRERSVRRDSRHTISAMRWSTDAQYFGPNGPESFDQAIPGWPTNSPVS